MEAKAKQQQLIDVFRYRQPVFSIPPAGAYILLEISTCVYV